MAAGDHIKVFRGLYWHHGIDVGDGTVIHSSGEPLRAIDAIVQQSDMREFCRGECPVIVRHRNALAPHIVLARAVSKLGCRDYHLLFNNCEHFATWCKTGERRSRQVEDVAMTGAVASYAARAVVTAVASRSRSAVLARVASLAGPAGLAVAAAGVSVTAISRMRRAAVR